jgi:hypothetical protein
MRGPKMATENAVTTATARAEQVGFARLKNETEAMAELQKELLLTCEDIGEGWASRLQSEAALWSSLIGKLATARSAPDCFGAYSDCVAQRLRMAEDDSRRLMEDYQRMAQRLSDALNNGLSPWRTVTPTSVQRQTSRKPRKRNRT